MTEAELNQYRAIKNEIEDLEFRIKQLQAQKLQVYTTKVKGSLSEFPYIEANFNVTGPDYDEQDRRFNRIAELERKKRDKQSELIEKEHEIHDFVYSIQSSELRQILVLTYVDGLTQSEIGRRLHMDQSNVSKKLSDFFKVE
jgi:DNA-directed RNA polymerase specialized sigma24 family protein